MKTLLFIPELIQNDYQNIYIKLLIVCGAWVFVLIAMTIDLGFGIQKAKKIGEFITSEGYRRSIQKFIYYYAMLLFALIFDCILSIVTYYLPFPLSVAPIVSLGACLGLILTEVKSVREKAEDKLRRRTDMSFKEVAMLFKDKDVVSQIFAFLEREKDRQTQANMNNNNQENTQP